MASKDDTAWLAPLVPALEALQREMDALARTQTQLLSHNDAVCVLAQHLAQVSDNLGAIAASAPAAGGTAAAGATR